MRTLELVNLIERGKHAEGLVPVDDSEGAKSDHERSVLLDARSFPHVHYVFFRRYAAIEGATPSSHVAAYVVDNTGHTIDESAIADLHHELWLHGVAPLVYVAWPARIDILSCARQPDFWTGSATSNATRYSPADRIDLPSQEVRTAARIAEQFEAKRRRLSARRLAEGTFWDDPKNQKFSKHDAAAHRSLIRAVVEADRDLEGQQYPIRRRLLVLVILIKYLEDRVVFTKELFGTYHPGAKTIRDILRDGTVDEVRRLLEDFEKKFNGDVFSLGDDAAKLTTSEFRRFARLVAANELGGQLHFWDLFDFKHIPVEVISRIYQHFVTGRGAVYTPPILAELLLDRAMPYERIAGRERILDPACGSGVFLVGAFKRLVVHWQSRNDWRRPGVDDLKAILAHSIHGIELERGAIDLTAFSLALAVCDALDPPVIWETLKFDKLRGRNLREGDFFDRATTSTADGHSWPEHFDHVVGNPPFESSLTFAAKAVDAERPKHEPKLADNQLAYLFLERSLKTLAPGGSLCLIQPHGLLYNSTPVAFRRHLQGLCTLRSVLDFVSIRGLFDDKDPKTVAWHATNEPADGRPVTHFTFRRTFAAAELIAFEIDHYDIHLVPRTSAESDPSVWRAHLLGGGRLGQIAQRFGSMPTLAEVVERNGWEYGEGFIVGKKDSEQVAPFLTGKPYLPTNAFTASGLDAGQIKKLKETHFKCPYGPERYRTPLLLIKEHSSLPVAFWETGTLSYRHKIVGIHAPREQRDNLHSIFTSLNENKRLYQFLCMVNGTQALVGKATAILKQDIDRLPVPEDPDQFQLSFWEEVLKDDVLDHMADYIRLGQNSKLLKNAAGPNDLAAYSALFVRLLSTLYDGLHAHKPVFLNGLVAQPFFFGERPDVSWLSEDRESDLLELVYSQDYEVLRTVRVVRHYGGNVILIVKPDRLRYWIRSTAIRDADDTLVELREQGW